MEMEVSKIVVIVEEAEVARTAVRWTLHNLVRYGDVIILLHVYPTTIGTKSRSKRKLRLLRLQGFQLALSFQDICINDFPNTKTEIIVMEGDQDGKKITELVRQIGASTLVVGLHNQSFLYRLAMAHQNIVNNFNCKVLAIKQPKPLTTRPNLPPESSTNVDFSYIEIGALSVVPEVHESPPKIPYKICPDPSAIIWRSRRRRR